MGFCGRSAKGILSLHRAIVRSIAGKEFFRSRCRRNGRRYPPRERAIVLRGENRWTTWWCRKWRRISPGANSTLVPVRKASSSGTVTLGARRREEELIASKRTKNQNETHLGKHVAKQGHGDDSREPRSANAEEEQPDTS